MSEPNCLGLDLQKPILGQELVGDPEQPPKWGGKKATHIHSSCI